MSYQPDPDLAAFIQSLPKTETHLHIEGALPYQLLQRLEPDRFRENPPFWADDYRYPSFETFENILLEHAVQWFTSAERYHEGARVVFEGLQAQNVKYVETSFHLGIVEFTGIPGPEIIDAIKSAAPDGMHVRVISGMLRRNYTPVMKPIIDNLHSWGQLDGIDLHGVEVWDLEDWSRPVWEAARAAGKITKAHAGEFGGAANVREVVDVLGVRRVQHGVRAVEDQSVLDLLVRESVTLDVCPISNVKLQVVPSMDKHPIRRLFDAGIRCTINTDDPFSFGNTLSEEYAALAMDLGFTRSELARIAKNGFEIARMPDDARKESMAILDTLGAAS